MDALFTAFDLTGLSTNTTTALLVGVGLVLLYVGFSNIKKVGGKLK